MAPSIVTPDVPPAPTRGVFTASLLGETATLVAASARVKSVDVHASQPWLLSARYDGSVVIHDLETGRLIKTFRVSTTPVRTAKFISRCNWIVTGSDDRKLRLFHLETNELVAEFEAHEDYVRALIAHETLPLVFSCGDDKVAKGWDWSKEWACVAVLQGHDHYAMGLGLAGLTVASVSLDHTVRLWALHPAEEEESVGLCSPSGEFTAHERGINAVAFNAAASRLATASDDRTVRVWDLATTTAVAVLQGHTANVTSVVFHPTLPLIVTGAEDESVRLWHSETFQCVGVWTHGMGRAWALAVVSGRNEVAIAYDCGSVVVALPAVLTTEAGGDRDGYVEVD